MGMSKLHPVALAVLAAALSPTLQGCGSKNLPTATVSCGGGCDVTYYCLEEGKLQTKVQGCTTNYKGEVERGLDQAMAGTNLTMCSAQVEASQRKWQEKATKDRICTTLQTPPETKLDCGGGCEVTFTCNQDKTQQTKATGCQNNVKKSKKMSYWTCLDDLKLEQTHFKADKKKSCEAFVGTSKLAIETDGDEVSPSAPGVVSSSEATLLTEEKGLYMVLGGALVTILYLLFRGIASVLSSSREARNTKLSASSAREATEMHAVFAPAA